MERLRTILINAALPTILKLHEWEPELSWRVTGKAERKTGNSMSLAPVLPVLSEKLLYRLYF